MLQHSKQFLAGLVILNVFSVVLSRYETRLNSGNVITPQTYAIWKNATVPFYVNPDHYDHEQTLAILSTLSTFAFKTCLKFKPVMARPSSTDEVMVFVNPDGTRRCEIETKGHFIFNPHLVKLGYDCLKSPDIDMLIMKALGFPFEHNRVNRDLYIDVLFENIRPGAIELFTKEDSLPADLRFLPYDINSVMHFGSREYSKNGHRTIIIKDHNAQQKRLGLTDIDLKKIEIVYGPECRARDRQEKLELCQSYPGVARKKREAEILDDAEISSPKPVERRKRDLDLDVTKSLRVNPDITPPPENRKSEVTKTLKQLGIDQAVQDLVEHVYKVSSLALRTARNKYCNNSEAPPITEDIKVTRNNSDILGIIELVADFAKGMVDNAVRNLTEFCEVSGGIEAYQRYSCDWSPSNPRCTERYRSTKYGPAQYSTQHRPYIPQPTKHYGGASHIQYAREGNQTEIDHSPNPETSTSRTVRRKRQIETTTEKPVDKRDETNKPEASESKNGDKIVKNQNKAEGTGEKKEETDLEKEAKVISDNKEKTVEEHKGEKIEAGESVKAEANGNETAVVTENEKTNNKESLRMKTMSPGLNRNNYNRRSHGKKHRDKHSRDYPGQDSESATEERLREKKHSTEEYERRETRHEKISRNKKMKHMASPVEEDREELMEIQLKDNLYHGNGENGDLIEEEWKGNKRPQKKRKSKKENPGRMSSLPKTVALSKENEEFYKERRWPDGELIYMIKVDTTYDLSDMRSRLAEVEKILRRKTCVKMIEIKPGEEEQYEDYILIDDSPDYVTGRVGGRQNFGSIELFRGGQHRQHAAMMVMAMLGFYFEVSRHDRDKYIRVHMRHVRPDKLHHFEMIRSDATLPLPYDYASATHPAWQFWRQMGRTGISTVATYKEKDRDGRVMKSLGQNEKLLSDLDIVKINSVYGVDCFRHPRAKTELDLGRNKSALPIGDELKKSF